MTLYKIGQYLHGGKNPSQTGGRNKSTPRMLSLVVILNYDGIHQGLEIKHGSISYNNIA